jgi:DNA-binding MarR family transcriptional regulator
MGLLAAELRLDASTLSRTVDGLVAKGLVERQRGAGDRRQVRIRLSASGKASCRAIHKDNDASVRRVFQRIPESRHRTVLNGFETLVQAYLDCEEGGGSCAKRSAGSAARAQPQD